MLDKMIKRPYDIESYDPQWVSKFNDIKKVVAKIFGKNAIAIEHVGSTSIPGMKAKPIIDVLIIVEKMQPFQKERDEMAALGYENGDDYIAPDTIIFFKTDGDRKTENIHVCVKDSPKAIQFLNTRDYVRTHPERAKAYSELKEKLKQSFPDDYPAYRSGKQAFIDETERLTIEWKRGK